MQPPPASQEAWRRHTLPPPVARGASGCEGGVAGGARRRKAQRRPRKPARVTTQAAASSLARHPKRKSAAGQPCWRPGSIPPPGRGRRTGLREPRLGDGCPPGGGLPVDLRRMRVVRLAEATCPVQGVPRRPRVAHKLCELMQDVRLSHGGKHGQNAGVGAHRTREQVSPKLHVKHRQTLLR